MNQFSRNVLIIFVALILQTTNANGADISGTIEDCDKETQAGMQVFIPGKPHVVITGKNGQFSFTDVPVGEYDINVMINGKILKSNIRVKTSSVKATMLGIINYCNNILTIVDTEVTSLVVTQPEAIEEVDCTIVSNGALIQIDNGKGQCENGKAIMLRCNKGYADCDTDISNGCETDIYNDINNCGECSNFCSELDSCDEGLC